MLLLMQLTISMIKYVRTDLNRRRFAIFVMALRCHLRDVSVS